MSCPSLQSQVTLIGNPVLWYEALSACLLLPLLLLGLLLRRQRQHYDVPEGQLGVLHTPMHCLSLTCLLPFCLCSRILPAVFCRPLPAGWLGCAHIALLHHLARAVPPPLPPCTAVQVHAPGRTHRARTQLSSQVTAADSDMHTSSLTGLHLSVLTCPPPPQTACSKALLWDCPRRHCCPLCGGRIHPLCTVCLRHAPHRGKHHEATLGQVMGLLIPQVKVASFDHLICQLVSIVILRVDTRSKFSRLPLASIN